MSPPPQRIRTRIWQEEPEPDNPFATRVARCHGFDVYGAMVGRARWVEMLFLLLRGEPPAPEQARLLEALGVALANPGPRDASVHAAMCGGVGGSTAASCLMAALAVGAGQYGGARDVHAAMQLWQHCGTGLARWREALVPHGGDNDDEPSGIWPATEHPPGFDPHGVSTPTIVQQALSSLAAAGGGAQLAWLAQEREALEALAGCPLAMSGVAAAALADLGFSPEEGEMLFLLLRLPGAAAHALEQQRLGHKQFPFFALEVTGPAREEALA